VKNREEKTAMYKVLGGGSVFWAKRAKTTGAATRRGWRGMSAAARRGGEGRKISGGKNL